LLLFLILLHLHGVLHGTDTLKSPRVHHYCWILYCW
jgi:hypothetical protein